MRYSVNKSEVKLFKWIVTGVILFLLYAPLTSILVFDLTLYKKIWNDESWFSSAQRSFSLALTATFFSQLICLLLLLRGRPATERLVEFLMGIPEILLSLSLLITFLFFQGSLGFFALLVAHVLLITPFCFLMLKLAWRQISLSLIHCAEDLGASENDILWKVQLPLMRPALVASFVFGFLLSFDDFLLSFYLGGVEFETLPVRILASLKIGLSPELKAVCTGILTLSLGALILIVPTMTRQFTKEGISENR